MIWCETWIPCGRFWATRVIKQSSPNSSLIWWWSRENLLKEVNVLSLQELVLNLLALRGNVIKLKLIRLMINGKVLDRTNTWGHIFSGNVPVMNLGLATLNNLRGTDISNKIVKLTGDNQKEGVCKVEQKCKGSLTNAELKGSCQRFRRWLSRK